MDNRMFAEIAAAALPVSLALARHMPAPASGSSWYRWAFDTIQDLAKNNDRIGEVRRSLPNSQPGPADTGITKEK